jgi:hypothetical protein
MSPQEKFAKMLVAMTGEDTQGGIMKGKVITLQLHDGSIELAVVISRNGSVLTVKTSDGYLHDTCEHSQDSYGIYKDLQSV